MKSNLKIHRNGRDCDSLHLYGLPVFLARYLEENVYFMGNGPFSQEAVVDADCPETTITGVRPKVGGGGGDHLLFILIYVRENEITMSK